MSGTPKTDKDLFDFLDGLGINYVNHEHRPVFTVAEGQDLRDAIPGGHTKNLFIKDKKSRFPAHRRGTCDRGPEIGP